MVTGHQGMAGEFGHISIDPNGPECACGRRGCWEMFASCRAALRYYRELEPHSRLVTFGELLSLAEDGNPHAVAALEKQAVQIGNGLRLVIAALSPDVIYIAGDVTSAWHRYGPILDKAVKDFTIAGAPARVVPSRDGDLARLRGAAALVFQGRNGN
jgi:predicted NBD/HSP70 family sugar kinase